jgi:TPR repeat protein
MRSFFIAFFLCLLFVAPAYAEKKSLSEIRAEAEKGDAAMQDMLGNIYLLGDGGVKPDAAEAEKWLRLAADQGYGFAQCDLALLLLQKSNGAEEAAGWHRKAADNGYTCGELGTGLAYFKGLGVARNLPEAAAWFRKAADKGDAAAQAALASVYAEGSPGVAPDYPEAYFWATLAARATFETRGATPGVSIPDTGDASYKATLEIARNALATVTAATQLRNQCAARLTPEQKATEDQRLAAWKPAGAKHADAEKK